MELRLMKPYYAAERIALYLGDCIEVMRALPEASVDAVVCDPPYGLEFMGKEWDSFAPDRKNASVWDGRRAASEGWEGRAESRSGRGGGGPQYASKQRAAKRCRICGRRSFSGTPCVCPAPDWELEYQLAAPSAMLAFQAWCEAWAREAYRVLKPGGHLAAFGGTRTSHRLVSAIEDAGFEIRDNVAELYAKDKAFAEFVSLLDGTQLKALQRALNDSPTLLYMFGSGFPKSLDVSKAIDKRPGVASHEEFAGHLSQRREAAGLSRADVSEQVVGTRSGACWNWEHHQFPEAKWWPALRDLLALDERWSVVIANAERERIGNKNGNLLAVAPGQGNDRSAITLGITVPATEDAQRWQGWGTALKPSHEPICLARKPLIGTVASNVLAHGTGALNIDGTRIAGEYKWRASDSHPDDGSSFQGGSFGDGPNAGGRWPSNVILDEEAAAMLDAQTGDVASGIAVTRNGGGRRIWDSPNRSGSVPDSGYTDRGGPSRFFYTSKASRSEREAGLDYLEPRTPGEMTDRKDGAKGTQHPRAGAGREQGASPWDRDSVTRAYEGMGSKTIPNRRNTHPTVKPVDLMRWLCRLVTPPGGVILDPFLGSGTTALAALDEGFRVIGIDMTERYMEIARYRVTHRHVLEAPESVAGSADREQGRLF